MKHTWEYKRERSVCSFDTWFCPLHESGHLVIWDYIVVFIRSRKPHIGTVLPGGRRCNITKVNCFHFLHAVNIYVYMCVYIVNSLKYDCTYLCPRVPLSADISTWAIIVYLYLPSKFKNLHTPLYTWTLEKNSSLTFSVSRGKNSLFRQTAGNTHFQLSSDVFMSFLKTKNF